LTFAVKEMKNNLIFMDKLAKVLDFFYGQDDHYQEREKGGRLLLSSK